MSDLNRQRKAGKTELYRHFDAKGVLLRETPLTKYFRERGYKVPA